MPSRHPTVTPNTEPVVLATAKQLAYLLLLQRYSQHCTVEVHKSIKRCMPGLVCVKTSDETNQEADAVAGQ